MLHWYIWIVSAALLTVGATGIVLLAILAEWAIIEKVLRMVDLHRCFVDFMFQWVKRRHEERELNANR